MGLFYSTREQVKLAGQINGPDQNPTIDRLLESASREIERSLNRRFYPLLVVRYYDFPNGQGPSYRLWLNADLIDIDTLDSAGIIITDYFMEPVNYGPPYNRVEIDLSSAAYFQSGDTWQRAIAMTCFEGYCDVRAAAGLLADAIDDVVTQFPISDSSLVGVGDLILIDVERMIVTEKTLLAGTAVDMAGDIAADEAVVAITVDDGTLVCQGEVITIDAERMLVNSIAGDVLAVTRAYDGSVLAIHLDDASIYAPRTLTVERAAAGTVAIAHVDTTPVAKNVPPGLISELCLAEVLYAFAQEQGHFALTAGQGDAIREISGRGIADVRKRAADSYGRTRGPGAI
jgi:hypothetical protein